MGNLNRFVGNKLEKFVILPDLFKTKKCDIFKELVKKQ